jgi:hypothetical protein
MSLLPTTLTGLPTMEEDSPQLLPPLLPRRNKGLFLSMISNQKSLLMNQEMMHGQMIKLISQMKLSGKLILLLLVLTILTLLKLQMRRSKLIQLKLHLSFKDRDKFIQSRTASLTSHHILKETTLGTMPSTTNPMR